jgi:hypothetical protein
LILNIDPVGPDSLNDVLDVATEHFTEPEFILPAFPSFPKAFINTWRKTTSKYIFNLEDDWELLLNLDLLDMIRIMDENPNLAVLRLPYKATDEKSKNWSCFYPWNGEFFECPKDKKRELGFCGHPSLIRGDFAREAVRHLSPDLNPEKQFHHGPPGIMQLIDESRFGVYAEKHQQRAIVDIGRKWMVGTGWQKQGNKAHFTKWENQNG